MAESAQLPETEDGNEWINAERMLKYVIRRQPDFETRNWRKNIDEHDYFELAGNKLACLGAAERRLWSERGGGTLRPKPSLVLTWTVC